MDRDRSILSKLLLGFMHLANEINKSLSRFGHTLLWPISKLELSYCPGLAILQMEGTDSVDVNHIKSRRKNREEGGENVCKGREDENKARSKVSLLTGGSVPPGEPGNQNH